MVQLKDTEHLCPNPPSNLCGLCAEHTCLWYSALLPLCVPHSTTHSSELSTPASPAPRGLVRTAKQSLRRPQSPTCEIGFWLHGIYEVLSWYTLHERPGRTIQHHSHRSLCNCVLELPLLPKKTGQGTRGQSVKEDESTEAFASQTADMEHSSTRRPCCQAT